MKYFHGFGRVFSMGLNALCISSLGLPGTMLLTLILWPLLILLTSVMLQKLVEASTIFCKRILSMPLLDESR